MGYGVGWRGGGWGDWMRDGFWQRFNELVLHCVVVTVALSTIYLAKQLQCRWSYS